MKGRWIRRGLTALLAILLAIAPMAATAEESTLRHVVNCEHWISLREEPSVKAKRIMKIPLRATVYLQEADKAEGFVRVYYGGYGGYVLAQYLSKTDPETGKPFAVRMYVANCNEYINLRRSESTSAQSLARLPLGTAVECLRNPNEDSRMALIRWTNPVTWERIEGYALRKYLSFVPAGEPLERVTLNAVRPGDKMWQQVITDRKTLMELASILRNAEPGMIGKCPLGAQLVFELKDGTRQYFEYPTDDCPDFAAENGEEFRLSKKDTSRLREIFKRTFDQLDQQGGLN